MALILTGCEGVDEAVVIDTSSAGPDVIAVYMADFDPLNLDASFRRNPTWRTFGHFSLCLENTVLWESWINFEYQVFRIPVTLGHANTEDLGFLDYPADSFGDYEIPYQVKWNLREGVIANVYWIT